jgi:MFS family permease
MVSLDSPVLNVAFPTLVRDLHAGGSQLRWIADAYLIVFSGLLLVMGSLADRVARKRGIPGRPGGVRRRIGLGRLCPAW